MAQLSGCRENSSAIRLMTTMTLRRTSAACVNGSVKSFHRQTSAHCKAKLFVPKDLQSCSHVFVRVDRVRRPLEAPYDGPFAVVSRSTDTFVVKVITKVATHRPHFSSSAPIFGPE